ncbi:MAG TPA: hypothetical protein VF733_07090 [Candidatus Saccharimonadales bacterium]
MVKKDASQPVGIPANPILPTETRSFRVVKVQTPGARFSIEEWRGVLRDIEVRDKRQQIKLRPWFAFGVFIILSAQNVGIWFILVWALHSGQLEQLQLIFSTLIAGTLAQSYLILRLITKKVFGDITYEHNDEQDDVKR